MQGIINAINRIVEVLRSVFVTIDDAHDKIHTGDHFYVKSTFIISDSITEFVMTTDDSNEVLHVLGIFHAEGEFNISIHEGVITSSDGSLFPVYNRDRNSSKTTVSLFATPVVTNSGVTIWNAHLGSGHRAGGDVASTTELILKSGTKYLFRVTKVGAGNLWFDFLFDWYHNKKQT